MHPTSSAQRAVRWTIAVVAVGLGAASCSTPAAESVEPAELEPVLITQQAMASVDASSFLSEERASFPPAHAFDDDRTTAWCEGADGLGSGEALTVTLRNAVELAEIRVDGGYFKNDRTLTNNGRPRKLAIASDAGWSTELTFPFVPYREHAADEVKVKPRVVSAPGKAKVLTFTLLEADEGRFTKDVCISEIALFATP